MICVVDGCQALAVGKSKFCGAHRAESRAQFKAMLQDNAAAKANRDARWEVLWNSADAAGQQAAQDLLGSGKLVPMIVEQHTNMMDDSSPVEKSWFIPEGPCGFAWVVVKPGNSSFALWCKKHQRASPHYYGGMNVKWVHEYGQSVQLKEAYARAFAGVLVEAGIKAYAGSRLD